MDERVDAAHRAFEIGQREHAAPEEWRIALRRLEIEGDRPDGPAELVHYRAAEMTAAAGYQDRAFVGFHLARIGSSLEVSNRSLPLPSRSVILTKYEFGRRR